MSRIVLLVMGFFAFSTQASAQSVCVFDPAGKSGDYYRMVNDFVLEASSWGVDAKVKHYTNEVTAVKDYRAGKCDAVVATGVRLQRFNNFPTTIEAIGALGNYTILRKMLKQLAKSKGAAKKMKKGDHETVGVIPIGAVYLFVRDRNNSTVAALSGKEIATLDYDQPSLAMVERVGAVKVPVDLGTLGPKFNNGEVDACYVSAPAYQPFELYKGLGSRGGILKLPLAQATLQVLARHEKFPADFGVKARAYFYEQAKSAIAIAKKAESKIPAKYWVKIPSADKPGFDKLFRETRNELRDSRAYHKSTLKVMYKLRCKANPNTIECIEGHE